MKAIQMRNRYADYTRGIQMDNDTIKRYLKRKKETSSSEISDAIDAVTDHIDSIDNDLPDFMKQKSGFKKLSEAVYRMDIEYGHDFQGDVVEFECKAKDEDDARKKGKKYGRERFGKEVMISNLMKK